MMSRRWRKIVELWHKMVSRRGRLECIPDIKEGEVAKLAGANYRNQNDLQMVLDRSGSGEVLAIQRIAEGTGLDTKRVAELLEASLHQSSEPLASSWLSKHWADLIIVAALVTFAMLPWAGKMEEAAKKAKAETNAAKIEKKPHIVAKRDLVPYVPLESGDLEYKSFASSDGANKLVADFTGRYPTQPIQAGQTIDAGSLSKNKADLKHFSILQVTLKLKPTMEGVALPRSADLLLSAHNTASGGTVLSVLLLNLGTDGLTATVAIPDKRIAEVTKWIGNSDVYLLFRIR